MCEVLIRDKVEVRSSRLKRPFGEAVVGVLAIFEDVVGDGLAAGGENVPRGCCSKDLGALGLQREDRNAAASAWIEKLLFSLYGGREFVVWVLGKGQHIVDRVVARRRLRK